ncbi:MAG: GNAT family N-acetyltransferase [Acetobacteraceae bacterium]|nr:GNAT family N-acetyltransferase [Acetobacteraceae bacterium]
MCLLVEQASHPTDEVRVLIGELEAILSAEYPPEQRHGLSLDQIFQPNIRFFIARRNGCPLGCGGIALFPDFAELKRMYVRQPARGQGVAGAILARLEQEASEAGIGMVRLETGTNQLAAIRFYERSGFRRCSPFGAYARMPPHAIATSVFFEKSLTFARR